MLSGDKIEPMLSLKDVAEILRVHVNTVRRWSKSGLLPAYQINHRGDRRFRRQDVASFLAQMNSNGREEKAPSPVFSASAEAEPSRD